MRLFHKPTHLPGFDRSQPDHSTVYFTNDDASIIIRIAYPERSTTADPNNLRRLTQIAEQALSLLENRKP